MTLGEVKDIVREHFGRTNWPTYMLDVALSSARRDVEKFENFYWMRSSVTFNTVASTQSYALISGSINKPNFKDLRALHVKQTGDTLYTGAAVGELTREAAFLIHPSDEENMPLAAVVDNTTLYLFPTPDQIYNMKLYHWEWTSNPSAGNTGSDELTSRFPEALIYG